MSRIRATYRIRADGTRIEAIAHNLALEQSVEVAASVVTDPFVAEHVVGRVDAIRPECDGAFLVDVLLATATTGIEVAQTLNMLFGNSSLHEHIELADVAFPADFVARFAGPRFGIAGIRRALGVADRPLTCAALKPQGLPPEQLGALCYTFAASGVDVIKDDHGLADQAYAPFARRVAACQRAVERANRESGRGAIYAPSLVGSPTGLARQAKVARDEGARMVLIAPALVGLPVFEELVRTVLDVPVLAHPAYAGAARVAPPLILGKFFRLFGADATIFPHYGGRFAYSEAQCTGIANAARDPWLDLAPMLPVPAGGLAVERVPELVRFYDNDVMLLIGGSLLAAGGELPARTRLFVDTLKSAGRRAQ